MKKPKLWTTPTASDHNASNKYAQGGTPLSFQAKQWQRPPENWPTPTINGNNNYKGCSPNSGDGLATAAKRFSTEAPWMNYQAGKLLVSIQIDADPLEIAELLRILAKEIEIANPTETISPI